MSEAYLSDTAVNEGSNTWNGVERRSDIDRREYSIHSMWNALKAPRRFEGRRRTDRHFASLDRFDTGICAMAIILVLLSITDSVFTLTLISRGGSEVNPFMNHLLQHSVGLFMVVKMLLTAIPALVLVAANNIKLFNKIRARSLLGAMVGLYAGLIIYEIGLLYISHPV